MPPQRPRYCLVAFVLFASGCASLAGLNDLEVVDAPKDASLESSTDAPLDSDSQVSKDGLVEGDASAPEAEASAGQDAEASVGQDAEASVTEDVDAQPPVDADASSSDEPEAALTEDADAQAAEDGDVSVPPDAADATAEDSPDVLDAVSEDAPVCTVLSPDATDVYVDMNASVGGTGVQACPVQTITLGLSLLKASTTTAQRTLHVAPGSYSANTGETLPLKVDFPVGILGAGSDPNGTRIVGTGPYSGALWGGTFAYESNARSALVVLTKLPVRIEALRFEAPQIGDQDYGIVCTTGNATDVAAPINLELSKLHVIRHRAGLLVTNATIPSVGACGVKVTNSVFEENRTGVWLVGAGLGPNTGTVAAIIGEGPGSGNLFKDNLEDLHPGAAGVTLWDGLSKVAITNNTFTHNGRGVAAGFHSQFNPSDPQAVAVENNTFSSHTIAGVEIWSQAILKNLIGNTFEGNVGTTAPAYGLLMKGNNVASDVSGVENARNNIFRNNDFGVSLENTSYVSDFGQLGSPGGNTFACNSTTAFWGADVQIKNCTATMKLVGNQWNHDPPTIGTADGADLQVVGSPNPDNSEPSLSPQTCDSTHIP